MSTNALLSLRLLTDQCKHLDTSEKDSQACGVEYVRRFSVPCLANADVGASLSQETRAEGRERDCHVQLPFVTR